MGGGTRWVAPVVAVLVLAGCRTPVEPTASTVGAGPALQVTSAAFAHEGEIPARYTCNGDNVSPPLAWSSGPPGTRVYAIVVDDPDAPVGTWTHWVAWNVSAASLAEGVAADDPGMAQGANSGGQAEYDGPCPPRPTGSHRYIFRVYALDAALDLAPGSGKDALLAAIDGHVLAQGELVGRYRQP